MTAPELLRHLAALAAATGRLPRTRLGRLRAQRGLGRRSAPLPVTGARTEPGPASLQPSPGGPRRMPWLTWKSEWASPPSAGTPSISSVSSRPGGRGIPSWSTSRGTSTPIASSCRSWRRRWTRSSAPARPSPSARPAVSAFSISRAYGPVTPTPPNCWHRWTECRPSGRSTVADLVSHRPSTADLIGERISEIRDGGVLTAGAVSPKNVMAMSDVLLRAGLDLLVIAGTVTSAEHISARPEPLNLKRFVRQLETPVIVGGCASYSAALHLMRTGAAGVLVGIDTGQAATSRSVTGLGAPLGNRHRRCSSGPYAPSGRNRCLRPRHRRRRDPNPEATSPRPLPSVPTR